MRNAEPSAAIAEELGSWAGSLTSDPPPADVVAVVILQRQLVDDGLDARAGAVDVVDDQH